MKVRVILIRLGLVLAYIPYDYHPVGPLTEAVFQALHSIQAPVDMRIQSEGPLDDSIQISIFTTYKVHNNHT